MSEMTACVGFSLAHQPPVGLLHLLHYRRTSFKSDDEKIWVLGELSAVRGELTH